MIGSSRSYAIGMAHFQIAGGLRMLLVVCATYLAIIGAVIGMLYYQAAGLRGPIFTSFGVSLILVMETAVLFFLGSFRIAGAIRTDLTSKMIESHRLMPIPSWRAAAGYLFGSTTHAIGFGLLNLVLAYVFASLSGTRFEQVTLSEMVLGLFVLMAWSLSALGAFHGKVYGFAVGAIFAGGVIGGYYVYRLLPGLALLISPVMGNTIFNFGTPAAWQLGYPVSCAAQIVFFWIFFAATCRAYRGTYATTFSMGQALLLIFAWTATSIMGLRLWESFHFFLGMPFNRRRGAPMTADTQVVASLIASLLLAMVAIRTLTVLEMRWRKPLWVTIGILFLVAAAIVLIPLGVLKLPQATARSFAITAVVAASHVACVYLLFRVMRRAKPVHTVIAVLVPGFLLWVGPLIVELIQTIAASNAYHDRAQGTGFASSFSPLALLTETWTSDEAPVSRLPSLICLALLPVLLGVVILRKKRKLPATVAPVVVQKESRRIGPAGLPVVPSHLGGNSQEPRS